MIELIKQPWSWWFSGIMIASIMVILNLWGKSFGFSSNLRTACAMTGAGKKVKLLIFIIIGALFGTYFYGLLQRKLPH